MLKKSQKTFNLERFKRSFIVFFLVSIFTLFLGKYLYFMTSQMLHQRAHGHGGSLVISDFVFPEFFQLFACSRNLISKVSVSFYFFCWYGFFLALLFALFFFLKYWINEKLAISSSYHLRSLVLDKFRSLPYEDRANKVSELRLLLSKDVENLSYNWHRLPVKFTLFFLSFFLDFCFFWPSRIQKITFFQFIVCLVGSLLFFFVFSAIIKKKEKIAVEGRKKRRLATRNVQREIELTNLADSMGVSEELKKKRLASFEEMESYNLRNSIFAPLEYIPGVLARQLFPFILLLLSGDFTNTMLIHVMMDSIAEVDSFALLVRELQEFMISKKVLKSFLLCSETDDNLEGFCPPSTVTVEEIIVEDLEFKYKKQQEGTLLKNYHYVFFVKKINYVQGQNGVGKSTLIRLLLGVLKPISGKIIIRFSDGSEYDLFSQLNLKHWREKNISFLSHQNLLEDDDGSTGERQWKNINQSLETKEEALIWIFDEADNAIDKEKQKKIEEKMQELVTKKKLVIYIRHKEVTNNE